MTGKSSQPSGKRMHLGLPAGRSVGVVGRCRDRSMFVNFFGEQL